MSSSEDQPGTNYIAGNGGAQPADANTKMGPNVKNTNANNPLQPATPVIDPANIANSATGNLAPPSSQELFDSEMDAGQGAVEEGGEQENKEANPADVAAAPAPPTDSTQPNTYGGNFGNSVQASFQDHDRASNQRSDATRGEFGQQEYNHGATHGGYGNQYRETNFAAEHNAAAEATEEKYYGQGAAQPGPQHNAYRAYDGRDLDPAQQGHAVRDTPPVAVRQPGNTTASEAAPASSGDPEDNRNRPGRADEVAAFQNDNGSATTGGGYAADYGHTSGVGLPADTPDNYRPSAPGSQNEQPGQSSTRGGYDSKSRTATPGQGAPAPVDAPDALQNPGYGYGHERSEQPQPGNPNTGNSRNGFGPAGPKEGNASQGHGSQGGSYDDENPGAHGPEYDNFTKQEKAQNYGQEKRDDFRPADGDQPNDGDYGAAPRRNAGRDEQ